MKAWQQWWMSLKSSEQQILKLAAVVLALGLFMTSVWQPLHQYRAEQQVAAQAAAAQLQWLHSKLPLLTQSGATSSGSLSDKVAQTSRSFGINVSRMQPKNDQLDLMVDDVRFEQLMRWLAQLQSEHGVQLSMLELSETEVAGMVRVRRLVLE